MRLGKLEIYCITDKGLVRDENQDRILYGRMKGYGYIFAVADGLGGYRGGSTASRLTLKNIVRYLRSFEPREKNLKSAIYYANDRLIAAAEKNEELKDMGSTICLVTLRKGKILALNAGDSRAYLYSKGKLTQLTRDHSIVWSLVEKGLMTKEEARTSTNRNEIYSTLGIENPKLQIDEFRCEFEKKDILLLCSDGLSSYFSDEELEELFSRGNDVELLGEHLFRQVMKRGAEDNVSFILATYGKEASNG